MKRKLTSTTPYGVVSRTTARSYTHVVVARLHDGTIHAMAWAGSHRLAAAQMRYWELHLKYRFAAERLQSWELTIFPVDAIADAAAYQEAK